MHGRKGDVSKEEETGEGEEYGGRKVGCKGKVGCKSTQHKKGGTRG